MTTLDEALQDFLAARKTAFETLDIAWARKTLGTELDVEDDVILAALHKARYEATDVAPELRNESRAWLEVRELHRLKGTPFSADETLPAEHGEGEVPLPEGQFTVGEMLAMDEDGTLHGTPPLRMLAYEIMGVLEDVKNSNGFDEVCVETLKRVVDELYAMSTNAAGESDLTTPPSSEGGGAPSVASPFRPYRRKQIAELADWAPEFIMDGVSISDVDRLTGSPKAGDKIARNPANHADRWLVAADYFEVNFEAIENEPQRRGILG